MKSSTSKKQNNSTALTRHPCEYSKTIEDTFPNPIIPNDIEKLSDYIAANLTQAMSLTKNKKKTSKLKKKTEDLINTKNSLKGIIKRTELKELNREIRRRVKTDDAEYKESMITVTEDKEGLDVFRRKMKIPIDKNGELYIIARKSQKHRNAST